MYGPPSQPMYPMAPAPVRAPLAVANDVVLVRAFVPFPPVCVKCGAQHGLIGRQQTLGYMPGWVIALMAFGCFIGLFVALGQYKSFTFLFPVCAACDRRWSSARLFFWLALGVPLALGLVGLLVSAATGHEEWLYLMWCLFLGAPLIGAGVAQFGFVRPRTVAVVDVSPYAVSLRGFCEPARQSIRAIFPE